MNIRLLSLLLLIPAYLGAMDSKGPAHMKDEEIQIRKHQADEFVQAARKCDVRTINKMLKDGFDPDTKDQYGDTALIHAASCNHFVVVLHLLEAGANPNIRGSDGSTALIEAAKACKVLIGDHSDSDFNKSLIYLLSFGAGIGFVDNYGKTAMEWYKGLHELRNWYLLARTSDNPYGESRNENYQCFLRAITLREVTFNSYIEFGKMAEVKRFLNLGMSVGASKNKHVATPLVHALGNPELKPEIVRMLLAAGANPNEIVRGSDLQGTILMMAVQCGNPEIVSMLLDAGADPKIIVSDKQAIDFARENVAIVELLGGSRNDLKFPDKYAPREKLV